MSELSQETINRALLGDTEAVKECAHTDNDYAIPCPVCKNEAVVWGDIEGTKTYSCNACNLYKTVVCELKEWNHRPNLHAAAKELYAPKWVPCSARQPELNTRALVIHRWL